MSTREVFHEGELAVQQRTGERAIAARNGAMIADHIMAGAVPFLAAQRMLAVSSYDADEQIWVSLWFGRPGFVQTDKAGGLVHIVTSPQGVSPEDPVASLLEPGHRLGLLAIELETRRRLRINGFVNARDGAALEVLVEEVFPNCPKYIQRRHLADRAAVDVREPASSGDRLDASRRARVARIDTAFVGSLHPTRGVDVSHRGGQPGFIRVEGDRTLHFPDYPGNSMFQTLGNLTVNPRAGLALVDFEGGRLLSLTGTTSTSFGSEDPQHPTGGTGRYWTFTVERWVEFALPLSLGAELLDRSPFNPRHPGGAP